MGRSYATAAGQTLDAVEQIMYAQGLTGSNSLANGGFWELGREQGDGAITGTVWRSSGTVGYVRRAGSFRIEANGYIRRFPSLTPAQKTQAMVHMQLAAAQTAARLAKNRALFEADRVRRA